MVEATLVLKLVHLMSVAVLLGNLATQAAWKAFADRSRDARAIAEVLDTMVRVDRAFTGAAFLVTFATGYATIRVLGAFGGSIGGAPWALWGLILMFASILAWYLGMRTSALRMADLADAAAEGRAALSAEYARRSVVWFAAWGVVVSLILVVAALMVFKPGG